MYNCRTRTFIHSFPTRRSADLILRRHALARRENEGSLRQSGRCALRQFPSVTHLRLAKAPAVWTDRKSTRLNSSHVKISYAVFCLKKKKQVITGKSFCDDLTTK